MEKKPGQQERKSPEANGETRPAIDPALTVLGNIRGAFDAPPDFSSESDVIRPKSPLCNPKATIVYRSHSSLSYPEDSSMLYKREQLIVSKTSTMYLDGEKERHLPGSRAGPAVSPPRRSPQLNTGKGLPFKPSEIEEFVQQFRESYHVSQFSGLLLGLSLSSYHIRELLVCWLFFSLLFVCVALLLLSGVLAVQAGEYLAVWARTLARMSPVVALAHADLPLKNISDARKLE